MSDRAPAFVVDPVSAEVPLDDSRRPAAMHELAIPIQGTQMNGHIYVAGGPGPHPVVALLHGYPGHERSLDLAQVLRRAGINVLFFHYRGSWGSGGLFSWTNAIEDVRVAIRFLRSPFAIEHYRIDPARVALVGHSLGAWLSLRVAADESDVRGAVALGLENMGADARLYLVDGAERHAWHEYLRQTVGDGRPIRAASADALFAELLDDPDRFDLLALAPSLARRPVLMIGATRDVHLPVDEHQHPLAAALRAAGSRSVADVVLDGDHSFSACRLELCRIVVSWLKQECGF